MAARPSHATPVRFDNPSGVGHFDWRPCALSEAKPLSILTDAASQTPDPAGVGVFRQRCSGMGVFAQGRDWAGEACQYAYSDSGLLNYTLPRGHGDEIRPDCLDGFGVHSVVYFVEPYAPVDPYSLFTVGQEAYVGVRFLDPAGTADYVYGWIGVMPERIEIMTGGGWSFSVIVLDTFAWGYETQPGKPVVVGAPEPGTLLLLGAGAIGVLRLRRRRR